MNETLKKLNEEKKADLITSIATEAVQKLFAETKASKDEDSGTFKFIISTDDVDRQGESVDQTGWDLSFYKNNPVVLWAHDYASLPIGVTTSIDVVEGKLVAEGKFAPADANPFAQQIRKLYDLGMVRATSVGFIPKEFHPTKSGVISKAELLEYSLVPVPANPHAITMNQVKELSLDLGMLKTKGLEFKTEEAPAPVAAEKTDKGAVADALNVIETRQDKWQKYCELMEAIDAFCTVYFDEATPVENFSPLLLETIEILKSIAGSGGADDDQMKAAKAGIVKMVADRKSIRESIDKNIAILKSAVEIMSKNFALGSILRAEGDAGGTREKAIEEKERSKNSKGLIELDNFIEARTLLRSVDNTIEKVLRNFNEVAKKHK